MVGSAGTTYATTQIYFNSVSMTGARDTTTLATTASYALAILGANPLTDVRDNAALQHADGHEWRARRGGRQLCHRPLVDRPLQLLHLELQRPVLQWGVVPLLDGRQPPTPHWDRCRSSDRPSFTAWRNETGKDASSISVDPLFASGTNLRPQLGSPLLGAGQTIAGITTDIVGDTRGDPPTIGAYENAALPPPPPNDDFANADVLNELQAAGGTRSGDNTYATVQAGEPAHAGFGPFKSLWYKFTPTSSRRIRFDTCNSGFDTVLAAYTGPSVDNLTPVASNDDYCGSGGTRSRIQFLANAGTTYYIAVAGQDERRLRVVHARFHGRLPAERRSR